MAASYIVTGSHRDVQVFSLTQVADVQVVEAITQPSGATFQRAIPYAEWLSDHGASVLLPTAQAIEDLISGGLAIAAQGTETTDAFGLSRFLVEFLVQAPTPAGLPGPLETTVPIPIESLTRDISFGGVLATYFGGGAASASPADLLRQAYDALVATGAQ